MAMDNKIKWATELIEEKLKLEDERQQKKHSSAMLPEVVQLGTPHLEEGKKHGPINKDIASLKGQERVRKSSMDLRKEILEVGGTEYLFKLHKKAKKKEEEKPEPEPEEITGPVAAEDFLKAAVQGRIQVVEKFLIDEGSPNTCDEISKNIRKREEQMSSLSIAPEFNIFDFKYRTALHRSSLEGHTEIVQKLLDRGATVDFRDRLDCTAMHWACRGGHLTVVKLLQEKGANLKLKDKLLSTPLHVATRTGVADVVEHLINNGVDVNSRDREGDTALHDAVRLNRYKIIKMLILHGADMLVKNLAGKTPADLVQLWQPDTREVLKKEEPNTTEMPT